MLNVSQALLVIWQLAFCPDMAFVVDWVLNNKDQPTIVCAYTVQINVLVSFMVKEKEKKDGRVGGERDPPPSQLTFILHN